MKLFPGARYSVAFAISIAIAKYADHLPRERQVKMARRRGLDIDSQTLWDQLDALAKVLAPGYAALGRYVLSQPVIGADETTWRQMGGKGKKRGGDAKKWQVWTAAAPDAVYYQIEDSRSAQAAGNLLGDYAGTIDHYGSRSRRGTEVAALLYSLIESAKLASVGPQTYLRAATQAALRDSAVLLPHELA